jgi:hydrogenase nickel incorporation protein HypA/HybF
MHELSIAESVVRIATEHADGRRIHRVDLRVGHLRQVVPSALEFAFELVAQGTPAEGAELAIEHVRAEGVCRSCGTRTVMTAFPLQCSRCGDLDLEVVAGEELEVDSLELDETLTTTGGSRHGD